MDNLIKLKILNITVTLRCSLRCKLCVADIPKYKTLPHFEADELCDIIDRCFAIVDFTERFQLSGGEPFLHKGLPALIEHAAKYRDKFNQLSIFANGTLLPSPEILTAMKKYRGIIVVYFSNYGEHSDKAESLRSLMQSEGISFVEKEYFGEQQRLGGWVDYGDYEFIKRSPGELAEIFSNCGVSQAGGIWSCRFGEIHRCTRSCSGVDFGKVPRDTSDYIDLYAEVSAESQKEKFRQLMKKPYITACGYCTGDFGTSDLRKRYPAAEQIT